MSTSSASTQFQCEDILLPTSSLIPRCFWNSTFSVESRRSSTYTRPVRSRAIWLAAAYRFSHFLAGLRSDDLALGGTWGERKQQSLGRGRSPVYLPPTKSKDRVFARARTGSPSVVQKSRATNAVKKSIGSAATGELTPPGL